jgi:hypothetical protein
MAPRVEPHVLERRDLRLALEHLEDASDVVAVDVRDHQEVEPDRRGSELQQSGAV